MGVAKAPGEKRLSRGLKRLESLPDLVDHRMIASKLGIDPETIRNWVQKGEFPLPWTITGTLYFYRLSDFRAWAEGKPWAPDVRFNRPEGG